MTRALLSESSSDTRSVSFVDVAWHRLLSSASKGFTPLTSIVSPLRIKFVLPLLFPQATGARIEPVVPIISYDSLHNVPKPLSNWPETPLPKSKVPQTVSQTLVVKTYFPYVQTRSGSEPIKYRIAFMQ